MKTKNLLLPKSILLKLIVLDLVLLLTGAYMKIFHIQYASPLLFSAAIFQIILSIITLIDVARNKIDSKLKWIIVVLFFNTLGSIYYLINRNSILGEIENLSSNSLDKLANIKKKEKILVPVTILCIVVFQVLGAVFKILHIKGSSIILVLSLLALAFLVISLVYLDSLREKIRKE